MTMKSRLSLACVSMAALVCLALSPGAFSADAATTTDPVTIVKQAAGTILQTLQSRRAEFTADPTLLRGVVRQDLLPLIDLQHSARLILGKAARTISEQQLNAFSEAMSTVLINRYADGLLDFRSDEQLEVMPMKGDNTDKLSRVRTRVKLEKGGFAPVDYAFHLTPEGWKAFDVTVEGISYVITYRNQIVPRVEADGIDKVTADILAGNVQLND
jgi:phospholipid transport system substrate-binding protein